jgi:hypothetical protein
VAPLARDAVTAGDHGALDDHAGAGARADDHAEHDARAGRSAVDSLREREAVRVVGQSDGPTERLGEQTVERQTVEADCVRAAEQAGLRGEGARRTDAHAAALARACLELPDQPGDRRDDGARVAPWRLDPQPRVLLAGLAEHDALDLRASEVDADPHHPKISTSFWRAPAT